jgi:hypothetical protein
MVEKNALYRCLDKLLPPGPGPPKRAPTLRRLPPLTARIYESQAQEWACLARRTQRREVAANPGIGCFTRVGAYPPASRCGSTRRTRVQASDTDRRAHPCEPCNRTAVCQTSASRPRPITPAPPQSLSPFFFQARIGGRRHQGNRAMWASDQAASVEMTGFVRLVANICDVDVRSATASSVHDSELPHRRKLRDYGRVLRCRRRSCDVVRDEFGHRDGRPSVRAADRSPGSRTAGRTSRICSTSSGKNLIPPKLITDLRRPRRKTCRPRPDSRGRRWRTIRCP